MTIEYIISQILTVISYMFFASTYYAKDRKKVMPLNCVGKITIMIAYFLLGAWSGVAMQIVAIVRNIAFMINEKINGKSKKIDAADVIILLIVCIVSIILALNTYQGMFSLLPIIATLMYTYAVCQKNIKTYKLLGIPIEILWTIYNIYIKSILGIALEFVMLSSCITGYVLEVKRSKKIKKKARKITQKFKRSKK